MEIIPRKVCTRLQQEQFSLYKVGLLYGSICDRGRERSTQSPFWECFHQRWQCSTSTDEYHPVHWIREGSGEGKAWVGKRCGGVKQGRGRNGEGEHAGGGGSGGDCACWILTPLFTACHIWQCPRLMMRRPIAEGEAYGGVSVNNSPFLSKASWSSPRQDSGGPEAKGCKCPRSWAGGGNDSGHPHLPTHHWEGALWSMPGCSKKWLPRQKLLPRAVASLR